MNTKRLRRGVIIFGASILGLLLLAVVLFFALGPKPAKPLPNPNGYDDLLKAAQSVEKPEGPDLASQEELKAWVSSNSVALKLLRVGLVRPCQVPTDKLITNYATSGADLPGLKSLAHLLVAEGKLAALENRPSDAAKSYLDAIALGNQMCHGGLLITRLVGIACEAIGGVPLIKLTPQLTPDQMRPLIPHLETIIENSAQWTDIADNERRFSRFYLRKNPSELFHPVKLVTELTESYRMVNKSQERHDLAAARHRLLLVEMALRCYQADQGKPAKNLQDLVPKYLKQVPRDPFSNAPLVYRPGPSHWTLYSLGPNRKDDGGTPMTKTALSSAGQAIGDMFYDSPW